jgi:D-alanyl-D-alanine carboxypeptidase
MRLFKTIFLTCLTLLVLSACGRADAPSGKSAVDPTVSTVPALPAPSSVVTSTPEALEPTALPSPTAGSSLPSAEVEYPPLSGEVHDRLSNYLDNLVFQPGLQPQRKAPGAVLLVDLPEGRFLEAAGSAELSQNQPVDSEDIFEIGSITKVFTSVLLLQLHEEGVLSLDDKLSKWLPEAAASIPNGEAMTLRQLASHTAGLNDHERDLYPMPALLTDRALLERGFEPAAIVEWVAENKPPLFPPGTPGAWQYSNTGYVLLGMVLEAATGKTIGGLYAQRIFEPLDLESATLIEGVPSNGQIVSGYNAMNGDYADMTRWNASGAWAAGALAMNAEDLAAFAHALTNGELYQNAETLLLMTDFVSTGQDRGFTGYGLGLAQIQGGVWGHAGRAPGFGSVVIINPESGSVVVFLGNSGSFNVNPMELATLAAQ